MKKLIACLFMFFTAMSFADENRERAVNGQVADVATTFIALAAPSVYEMNPLGLLALPVKYAAIKHADTLPEADKQRTYRVVSALGWGASANNICVILTAVSGGASSIPCLFLGLGTGLYDFKKTEEQQKQNHTAELNAICDKLKIENPEMKCVWTY